MVQSISNIFIWETNTNFTHFTYLVYSIFLPVEQKNSPLFLNHYLSSLDRLVIKETTFKKQLMKVKIPFNNRE